MLILYLCSYFLRNFLGFPQNAGLVVVCEWEVTLDVKVSAEWRQLHLATPSNACPLNTVDGCVDTCTVGEYHCFLPNFPITRQEGVCCAVKSSIMTLVSTKSPE